MKIGLMFVNSGPFSHPELLAHLAMTAEQCGVESMWTVEHVVIPQDYKSPYPYSSSGKIPGGEDVAIPDPLLPLSFVAAITKQVKLATGVLILPQRHPLYVAKEVATLDVLSNGRTILGIGSGWLKEEFDALGLDFHTRGARTDEAIKALRALWSDNPSSFHGKHFNFGPVMSFPEAGAKGRRADSRRRSFAGGGATRGTATATASSRRSAKFPSSRNCSRLMREEAEQARPQGRRDRAVVHGPRERRYDQGLRRTSESRASWSRRRASTRRT